MTAANTPQNAHDVPGLGERRAKALKIRGATDWWFYPALLIVAVALVLVSLGAGAFGRTVRAQSGQRAESALVFAPEALANGLQTRNGHVLHVAREFGLSPRAVRIGVRPGMEAPTADRAGAELLLTPETGALLAGKPLRVEVSIKRITVTNAVALAVAAQTGGPIGWTVQTMPAEDGVMTFDLPATGAPLKALGFWVLSDKTDYNYGVEITRVRVTPLG
jgi:hypothetical protein